MGFTEGYDYAFRMAVYKCNQLGPGNPHTIDGIAKIFAMNKVRSFEVTVVKDEDDLYYERLHFFLDEFKKALREAEKDFRREERNRTTFSFDLNAEDDYLNGR